MSNLKPMAVAAASLLLVMCGYDWDAFDPRLGDGSGGASTTDGGGGVGAAPGGMGGVDASGGMGGAGGDGGDEPALVDRGLIARYFINEAGAGTGPGELVDSAPDPLPLALSYGDVNDALPMGGAGGVGGAGGGGVGGAPGPGGPNMSFTEVDGHRGLTWIHKNISGRASTSVSNTKVLQLDQTTQGTIECVAEIEDAGGTSACGRLSHLGVNNYGSFTLCVGTPSRIDAFFNRRQVEAWSTSLSGRIVLHYVLDTALVDPAARVLMYLDGADLGVGNAADEPPMEGELLELSTGLYALGNRIDEEASFMGTLFYCALYSVAFTPEEVANNAALLLLGDDAPPGDE